MFLLPRRVRRLGKGVEGFSTNWDEPWLVFNWHPLCMLIAYTTLYAHGTCHLLQCHHRTHTPHTAD